MHGSIKTTVENRLLLTLKTDIMLAISPFHGIYQSRNLFAKHTSNTSMLAKPLAAMEDAGGTWCHGVYLCLPMENDTGMARVLVWLMVMN